MNKQLCHQALSGATSRTELLKCSIHPAHRPHPEVKNMPYFGIKASARCLRFLSRTAAITQSPATLLHFNHPKSHPPGRVSVLQQNQSRARSVISLINPLAWRAVSSNPEGLGIRASHKETPRPVLEGQIVCKSNLQPEGMIFFPVFKWFVGPAPGSVTFSILWMSQQGSYRNKFQALN